MGAKEPQDPPRKQPPPPKQDIYYPAEVVADLRDRLWRAEYEVRGYIRSMDYWRERCYVAERKISTGDLTKEEIHNMCHNLEKTVSRSEFEAGCKAYQDKIFGTKSVLDSINDTFNAMKACPVCFPKSPTAPLK